MVNGIRTIYPRRLNKGFCSKFRVGSTDRHKRPKEDRRLHRPKRCKYNNEDEDNCSNILNDKNYQASSQKFWQITTNLYCPFYTCSAIASITLFIQKLFLFAIIIIMIYIYIYTYIYYQRWQNFIKYADKEFYCRNTHTLYIYIYKERERDRAWVRE